MGGALSVDASAGGGALGTWIWRNLGGCTALNLGLGMANK